MPLRPPPALFFHPLSRRGSFPPFFLFPLTLSRSHTQLIYSAPTLSFLSPSLSFSVSFALSHSFFHYLLLLLSLFLYLSLFLSHSLFLYISLSFSRFFSLLPLSLALLAFSPRTHSFLFAARPHPHPRNAEETQSVRFCSAGQGGQGIHLY